MRLNETKGKEKDILGVNDMLSHGADRYPSAFAAELFALCYYYCDRLNEEMCLY